MYVIQPQLLMQQANPRDRCRKQLARAGGTSELPSDNRSTPEFWNEKGATQMRGAPIFPTALSCSPPLESATQHCVVVGCCKTSRFYRVLKEDGDNNNRGKG